MPARNVRPLPTIAPVRARIGAMLAVLAIFLGVPAQAQNWPSAVRAIYKIQFAGLELGTFEFGSHVNDQTYALTGNAQITAMFGAYEWRSQTRSSGTTAPTGPKPNSYAFNFKAQSKTGNIQMTFNDNVVTKVLADPPGRAMPDTVPLKDSDLKDVLDPLSAVMALTRATSGRVTSINPCGRRMPVFDGKQRFDLVFSFKRRADIAEIGAPNAKVAYVCRVKYVPISGYRMNDEVKQMTEQTGIEVWMVPLPEANSFVPYYVLIPTLAGSVTLTAYKIDMNTSRGRVALSQ